MMLPNVPVFWEQLTEPNTRALLDGLQIYMRQQIEEKVDRFDEWSIETANDEELNVIASLMGVPRPMMWNTDDPNWESYWRYASQAPEGNMSVGFGDNINDTIQPGGKLSDGVWEMLDALPYVPMPAEYFRIFLSTIADSPNQIGSLALLDELCYAFVQDEYRIEFDTMFNTVRVIVTTAEILTPSLITSVIRIWRPDAEIIYSREVPE